MTFRSRPLHRYSSRPVRERALSALPSFALRAEQPECVGLMTVKTGPLASGGIDMESAPWSSTSKSATAPMAGRKVELFVGDSGGVARAVRDPRLQAAGRARQRSRSLIGPLDTASALASDDYIRSQQLLTLRSRRPRT